MESKKEKFLELIDQAIQIGQQMINQKNLTQADDFSLERLNPVIDQLETLRNNTLNDQLGPSLGKLTFGLARELADWIDLDSPLLKAVGAIERYYQQQF
ncbi:hypothetical protein [Gloeothece verrucosa]|uniref:Uncharacterized protein n=1 Tax=Gloeothece verrucosa (strain PCC 7822) TaxID=497965 RepID=E0U5K4_GLOV7|nr:hypothetical protein [Gloeothece verrucosa]ADN14717.1 conserved hypothetical protein [Gloeothece verrucosa PCC 7822]